MDSIGYDPKGHTVLLPPRPSLTIIPPTELKPIPAMLPPPPPIQKDYLEYAEIALLLTALACYTVLAIITLSVFI